MSSSVRSCKCKHESQDQMYGPGRRVHTRTTNGWRCTVCGNELNTTVTKRKK